MTPEEEKQFNLFGCASRCIIRASVLAGKPITRNAFIKEFGRLFPKDEFGLLSLDKQCHVLISRGLCDDIYSVRNAELAKKAIRANQIVFVLTDLKLDAHQNRIGDNFHCRLGIDWKDIQTSSGNDVEFLLFSPDQDGNAGDRPVLLSVLEKQLVHFLILA